MSIGSSSGHLSPSGTNALEQFVILAKNARGAAAKDLVMHAISSPGVYVFGELLTSPNVEELGKSADGEMRKVWDLLNLFAYGTFEDFVRNRAHLPSLSPPMILKLQQLTVVTLVERNRRISYSELQKVLHVGNVRELEDLIIDAIYKGVIRGKLDQQNQCLEVEQCRGRDVRPEKLTEMIAILSHWCDRCQSVLINLEQQIKSADERKQQAVNEKKKVEEEFNNLKKTLRAAGTGSSATPDIDDNAPGEVTSTRTGQEPERKKEKTRHKGLRGSSKIFTKHSN